MSTPVKDSTQETPGYIQTADGLYLYSVHFKPVPSAASPILIIPPLFEERKGSYLSLGILARALAQTGHHVLRFDYRGSGESGGHLEARRWSDLFEDLAAATKALRELSGRRDLIYLGLRIGATLALLQAAKAQPRALIALAPQLKGKSWVRHWTMRAKIRSELTREKAASPPVVEGYAGNADTASPLTPRQVVDLDGYGVGQDFIEDCKGLDLSSQMSVLTCPSLLVQISHQEDPVSEFLHLRGVLGSECSLKALKMEPFWERVDDVNMEPLTKTIQGFLTDALR